jgi:hypothetical protein
MLIRLGKGEILISILLIKPSSIDTVGHLPLYNCKPQVKDVLCSVTILWSEIDFALETSRDRLR